MRAEGESYRAVPDGPSQVNYAVLFVRIRLNNSNKSSTAASRRNNQKTNVLTDAPRCRVGLTRHATSYLGEGSSLAGSADAASSQGRYVFLIGTLGLLQYGAERACPGWVRLGIASSGNSQITHSVRSASLGLSRDARHAG